MTQSGAEVDRIKCNRDVGLAVLEAYSRVLGALAAALAGNARKVLELGSRAQQ